MYICAVDVVQPIDLVFLIDGSINAGEDNFNKELTFVRKLCNRLVKNFNFAKICQFANHRDMSLSILLYAT